jgi:hypothetical protein
MCKSLTLPSHGTWLWFLIIWTYINILCFNIKSSYKQGSCRGFGNRGTIDLCSAGMQARTHSKWWIMEIRARNWDTRFILVKAFALAQCSVDSSIVLRHVTAGVLVCRKKVAPPFYSSWGTLQLELVFYWDGARLAASRWRSPPDVVHRVIRCRTPSMVFHLVRSVYESF